MSGDEARVVVELIEGTLAIEVIGISDTVEVIPAEVSTTVVEMPTTVVTVPDINQVILVPPLPPSVVEIGIMGPPGPAGPQGPPGAAGSAPQSYDHDQQVPLSTWTINHNLGFVPNVTVIDTLGESVWGQVTHPSTNQTVLVFTAAFSGHAYFS